MNSELSREDNFGQDGESPTAIAVAQPVVPVETLIGKAIEQGISVEGLERLLAMRDRLRAEDARAAFFEAMTGFQADCPVIGKTRTARIESRTGGSYTYRYAPLEVIVAAVSPILHRYGLSYRFDTRFEDNPPAQHVICTVTHVQGHSESSEFRSPVDSSARMNVMQQSAAAQTYAKRYALVNALGILTGDEDNDGHTGVASGGRAGPGAPRAAAAPPSAPPSTGRVVRIARPSPGPQDSGGPASQDGRDETVPAAETPAASEKDSNDAEKAKADLRQGLIESQMTLLRLMTKYRDWPESELWDKAVDVLGATCEMHFRKPLHEMSRVDLERAKFKMDETVRQRTGDAA